MAPTSSSDCDRGLRPFRRPSLTSPCAGQHFGWPDLHRGVEQRPVNGNSGVGTDGPTRCQASDAASGRAPGAIRSQIQAQPTSRPLSGTAGFGDDVSPVTAVVDLASLTMRQQHGQVDVVTSGQRVRLAEAASGDFGPDQVRALLDVSVEPAAWQPHRACAERPARSAAASPLASPGAARTAHPPRLRPRAGEHRRPLAADSPPPETGDLTDRSGLRQSAVQQRLELPEGDEEPPADPHQPRLPSCTDANAGPRLIPR